MSTWALRTVEGDGVGEVIGHFFFLGIPMVHSEGRANLGSTRSKENFEMITKRSDSEV